jgi:hypothetical protein
MPDAPLNDLQIADQIDGSRPMSDPNNSRVFDEEPDAPDLGTGITPPPVGGGLTGATGQPAAPATPTPVHQKVAQSILSAFSGSDGTAGGFLRSVLAGGLAGASAAASAPQQKGGGVAHGLALGGGAGYQSVLNEQAQARQQKQQNLENQQKQAAIDLAKQKAELEKTTGDREYDLRLREDARQQAASIRDAAAFEKRGVLMDQQIAAGNFEGLKQQADYIQKSADDWNDLQGHGGTRLKVNGAESPEFDHLGDAEDFAMQHPDESIHGQFKTRLMRNPDTGKWAIMETPYEQPKWHEVTDASGKPQKIFTDTQGALAAQKEIAETKHYLNVASRSSLELKEELEGYKEQGTVKGARKELDAVGGDYSKLSPGSKSALLHDANDRFLKAQTGLEKELNKPEDLRDKDTVDFLTNARNTYAKEVATLTRPSFVSPPGEETPAPAAAAAPQQPKPATPTPPRPANVPANYEFNQNGPKGPGWYKPAQAPVAAAPEPEPAM